MGNHRPGAAARPQTAPSQRGGLGHYGEDRGGVWCSVVSIGSIWSAAIPFLITLGVLSLLVATLSTIGIFLRLRTASLSEIQLRLAAREDLLLERGH
jgi:hypothetical protein